MAEFDIQNPRSTQAWAQLSEYAKQAANLRLATVLDTTTRFSDFSIKVDGVDLVGDFSRSLADARILDGLVALAMELKLPQRVEALIGGAVVNGTEQRAALHSALRGTGPIKEFAGSPLEDAEYQLNQFLAFAEAVRNGSRVGSTGQRFKHVINIGIGGSDLGPRLVADALVTDDEPVIVRFVAGIDGIELQRALADAEPETALVIVCSKTFTTLETRLNAEAARNWLRRAIPSEMVSAHFAAISVNETAMDQFGIAADARFHIWDWVGGRYSLWSAIGLSAAIATGAAVFRELLAGAAAMDQHFRSAPMRVNLPVMLGLLAVWQQDFCGVRSHIILPYDQRLQLLPAYLQQLFMESLGKSVRADGAPVDYPTGCPVWGAVGSHSQHSFAQMLHQGNATFQVDYIAAVVGEALPGDAGHRAGLANMLAQAESLARGQSSEEVAATLRAAQYSEPDIQRLVPHKVHPGNRPSNIILLRALTPACLGALLALYEHQVYVQSVIWGINPFDQWGVELGKVRAVEYSRSLTNGDFGKLPPVADYILRWRT